MDHESTATRHRGIGPKRALSFFLSAKRDFGGSPEFSRHSIRRLSVRLIFVAGVLLWGGGWRIEEFLPGSPSAIDWVWSGAVTSDSAVIKARTQEGAEEVRLLLATDPSLRDPRYIPEVGFAHPDENGTVTFVAQGLQPATLYHYSVEAAGRRTLSGRFKTFADGPMSFEIAFASCATTGSRHRIFSTIKSLNPLFFLHMGDFHYENISTNDPRLYHRAYDRVLASDRQAELYRHTPIAYVWDDHDFGPNDCDRLAPGKPAALKAYQQCVPHYPLDGSAGSVQTINQAFTVGRVRFIMTDLRAERSPAGEPDGPGKTMLGTRQLDWFLDELSRSKEHYPLVVWVNTVPWITKKEPGGNHGWEPYSRERRLIADRIRELGLVERLLVLSGDAHMVAIDDGTHSNYASAQREGERAFPVVQAAPLDRYPRVKGGPYSHGVHAEKRFFGLVKIQQFGFMKVEDDGEEIRVELSGHDADGRLLKGMLLKLSCSTDGSRIIR